MSPLHFNLTDRGTSPAPRSWQSTWDSRPQPRRWCQHLQGRGCSDGNHFDSSSDSWTGWSQYLLPELRAVSRKWRWLATRTQLPSPEGSRISAWSRTWRSTTLPDQNRVSLVLFLHIITHYYTLLRTGGLKLDFIAERDVGTLNSRRSHTQWCNNDVIILNNV